MNWKTTNDIAFAIAVEATEAVNTAHAMIRDAKLAAHAKRTAEKHTECRQCQAALENFILEFPDCSEEVITSQLQDAWETCGACSEEYHAHLDRQAAEWEERQRGLDNPSEWEVQNGY